MSDTITARVLRQHIADARAILPNGDALTTQAVVDHLACAGLTSLQAQPASLLERLQASGNVAVFPCGLTMVAHWIDDNRRSLVAIGHRCWTVEIAAIPGIVRALEACTTVEEGIGAVCGLTPS